MPSEIIDADNLKRIKIVVPSNDTIFIKTEGYANTNGLVWIRNNIVAWNKANFVYISSTADHLNEHNEYVYEKPSDYIEKGVISADTLRMIKPRFFELVENWDTTALLRVQSTQNSRKPAYDMTTVYRIILKDNKISIDHFGFYEIDLNEGTLTYWGDEERYDPISYNELHDDYKKLVRILRQNNLSKDGRKLRRVPAD